MPHPMSNALAAAMSEQGRRQFAKLNWSDLLDARVEIYILTTYVCTWRDSYFLSIRILFDFRITRCQLTSLEFRIAGCWHACLDLHIPLVHSLEFMIAGCQRTCLDLPRFPQSSFQKSGFQDCWVSALWPRLAETGLDLLGLPRLS